MHKNKHMQVGASESAGATPATAPTAERSRLAGAAARRHARRARA